jgi:hypothetical protein
MIADGLSWHQFASLPHIMRLPLAEQIREYDIYNQTLIQEVLLQQQYYNQQVVVPNTAGGGIDEVVEEEDPLPSNCIQFTANTFDDTNFEVIVGTSAETTYTINWGDGNTGDGTLSAEDTQTISHSYENSSQEYTIRLCFADASAVTSLEFEGND